MSTPDTDWNPEDGEAPTEEELREAARLADALDRPVAPAVMTPDTAELLSVAGRVKAVAHPDDAAAKAAVDRAIRHALKAPARPAAWWSPARLRFAAAAAAVLAAAGVGGREYLRARPAAAPAQEVVFDAPVEPGAGSAPASRLYDHGLRGYRDGLLGGSP